MVRCICEQSTRAEHDKQTKREEKENALRHRTSIIIQELLNRSLSLTLSTRCLLKAKAEIDNSLSCTASCESDTAKRERAMKWKI